MADAQEQAQGHYAVLDVTDPGLIFGEVENEDYVVAILKMASGTLSVCEANRAAVGEQNNYAFEVHGTQGLVRWDFRRPGELQVSSGDQYAGQPTSTVFSEPGDGEYAAFQPGAGIAMGYDDTKVVEARNFIGAISGEAAELATLDDAVASASVLDAMVASHRDRRVGEPLMTDPTKQGDAGFSIEHRAGAADQTDRRDRLRPDRADARRRCWPARSRVTSWPRWPTPYRLPPRASRRRSARRSGRSRSCWPPRTSTPSRSARAPTPMST